MRLEIAIALVVWHHGRHHDGAAGAHRETVSALEALRTGGIDIPDVRIEHGPGGPRSPDVSLMIERLMAGGVIRRMTRPLQFTSWGLSKVGSRLRRLAARDASLASELRRASALLSRYHAECSRAAAPEGSDRSICAAHGTAA